MKSVSILKLFKTTDNGSSDYILFLEEKVKLNFLLYILQMAGRQDEEYEVLDLAALRRNQSAFRRMLGDVTRQSVAKQIVIGGAAGW